MAPRRRALRAASPYLQRPRGGGGRSAPAAITDDDTAGGFIPWLDALSAADDAEVGPIGPGSSWDGWDLVERREFLSLVLDRVEVRKGAHSGGNTPFRGDQRLRLVWAGA